jgi:hypothetical protein
MCKDNEWTEYNDGSGIRFRRAAVPKDIILACQAYMKKLSEQQEEVKKREKNSK